MAEETRETRKDGSPSEMERTVVIGQPSEAVTLPTRPPGPLPNVPRQLGAYDLVEQLGQGGMGVVFRAVHRTLGTPCAVKVLIAGEHASAESIARFQREAAAVARMGKHPNIVTVFDLGQEGSLAYYAMELVDGKSLRAALEAGPWAPAASASMVEKVARALHFAHEHGIVHRDMKPENVVVRADGEPQVMDFGLAKDVRSGASLTVTGQVFGTPNYMAPEQARGRHDECDARTDVYALGAMLYEMLTRKPPHPDESAMDVLEHVVRGEVVRPSRLTSVPRDLETVTMKCLEAAPSGRYPTAQALAEDLARFRRGEPVTARPVGWVERLVRRARRNPLVSGLAAALVLAAATGALVTWRASVREAEERRAKEEAVAAVLRELSRSGKALVDAALARRALGDVASCRSYFEALEEPVRELVRRAPGLAEPWFHRGRMLRALQRNDEAEAAQDRAIALASAPDATPGSRAILPLARYERGVLRMRRYNVLVGRRWYDRLRALGAQAGPGATPEEPELEDLEVAYPEVVALREATAADLRGASGTTASALLAALERRDDAGDRLQKAVEADRWLTEGYQALAWIAVGNGDWKSAALWYGRGREADRGYVPHASGRAQALYQLACVRARHGEDAAATRREAIEAAESAIALDARCVMAWLIKTMAIHDEAQALLATGKDPMPALEEALVAAKHAVEVALPEDGAEVNLGAVLVAMASARQAKGEDPAPDLAGAIEAFEEAVATEPTSDLAAYNLALAHHRLGDLRRGRGEDGRAEIGEAMAGYERALAINPRYAQAANNLAALRKAAGDAKRARGEDPTAEYDAAIEGFRRATSIRPSLVEAVIGEAWVLQAKGDHADALGRDPREFYAQAIGRLDEAIRARPDFTGAHLNRAAARILLGQAREDRGESPEDDFDRAIEGYRAALRINARYASAQRGLATALVSRARLLAPATGDADETSRRRDEAFRLIEESLRVSPEAAAPLLAHPAYEPLHDDPRWKPVGERIGR